MTLDAEFLLSLAFYGSLGVVVVWEHFAELRPARTPALVRWPNNIAIGILGFAAERWLLTVTGFGAALYAAEREIGLMPALGLPGIAEIVLSVLLLDLLFYLLHRLSHAVPFLWSIHCVHHSDTDFDVTVGFRRHPVELLINVLIAVPVILLLGVPLAAIVLFQVMRAAVLFFEHANVQLPERLDRCLRYLIVTPNMHRVHHSATRDETDSNFSDLFPMWDRLLGTYRASSREPQTDMTIGLEYFRQARDSRLDRLLLQPWTLFRTRRRDPAIVE
jgi:sterol desaturase/sphingolipid hydroxylase (fatty acid hydroxylase superfamily)